MYSPHFDFKNLGQTSPGGSEPMTLGSPVSSPPGSNPGGVNYLPPYLIGDAIAGISSFSQPSSVGFGSPVSKLSSVSFSNQPQHSPLTHMPRRTVYQSPAASSTLINGTPVGKTGGPPVQSLFDTVSSPRTPALDITRTDDVIRTPGAADMSHFSGILTPSKSFSQNNSSYLSPAQIDPFYTQGEALTTSSHLDESWVTVFGFPPASTTYILQQFSQYGKITDHKISPSGNWIHIKYQSKLQAKKALSKNGKVFGGSIMVGVKPCIEMDVMNESTKENSTLDISANFCQDSLSLDSSCIEPTKPSLKNIRPLTQFYKTPTSDSEVTPKTRMQQKASNLVSKTMEYILNW